MGFKGSGNASTAAGLAPCAFFLTITPFPEKFGDALSNDVATGNHVLDNAYTQIVGVSDEETKNITQTMKHNAQTLNRLVQMLYDSSALGINDELNSHQIDNVSCNDVAKEAMSYVKLNYPELNVSFNSSVPSDLCIKTNQLYLMRSLRELLYNAAKYSDGQRVAISVSATESAVTFTVEDTGKGISEADHDLIFEPFTKVDDLTEGLGLGLPLAKRHAQNLGGDLTLDVNYHDGCRFIIELPVV